jgi:hypothetical protein
MTCWLNEDKFITEINIETGSLFLSKDCLQNKYKEKKSSTL